MANGLGRGLGSLIPPKVNKVATTSSGEALVDVTTQDDRNRIMLLSPNLIKANPEQPRKRFSEQKLEDLKESIKQYGIIQPLIVSRRNDQYELIAGERRLRASKAIGLDKVPVIIRNVDELEKLELALIENIQREDLNPIETALAYRKLVDEFNISQEDMSKRVGKPRSSVTNTLRLLSLPEEIQQALIDGKITEGHAKIILGLEGEVRQMALYRKIVHSGLSVNTAIEETRKMGGTKAARNIPGVDQDKELRLREFFGSKAEVRRKGKGGQIIISFYSEEELDGIMKKLN